MQRFLERVISMRFRPWYFVEVCTSQNNRSFALGLMSTNLSMMSSSRWSQKARFQNFRRHVLWESKLPFEMFASNSSSVTTTPHAFITECIVLASIVTQQNFWVRATGCWDWETAANARDTYWPNKTNTNTSHNSTCTSSWHVQNWRRRQKTEENKCFRHISYTTLYVSNLGYTYTLYKWEMMEVLRLESLDTAPRAATSILANFGYV